MSNPGYVFADWAGIDDDDDDEIVGIIIRKYNYRLETGTVGTDDDNIANILYNINRMEMNVSFSSTNTQVLDKALGELFFMVVDSKVHLNQFLKIFCKKVNPETVNTIVETFDRAIEIVRGVRLNQTDDTVKMSEAFPTVYKMLLAIVPTILALDAQAVGRV